MDFTPQEAMDSLNPALVKDNSMSVYPRFQWSKFSADKSEQFVVREDDIAQFNKAIQEVKIAMNQVSTVQRTVPTQQFVPDNLTSTCPLHNNAEMTQKNGQYGPYWSHTIENVGYCNGKRITPFKK